MFLSDIHASLSPSVFKNNEKMSSGEDLKNKELVDKLTSCSSLFYSPCAPSLRLAATSHTIPFL